MIGRRKLMGGLVLLLSLILGFGPVKTQDKRTENLQSIVLEDFSLGQDGKPKRMWAAFPDRFGRKDNLEAGESLSEVSWIIPGRKLISEKKVNWFKTEKLKNIKPALV